MGFKVSHRHTFKPGNPMLQDKYRMGTSLGTNLLILHEGYPGEDWEGFEVVNTATGESMRVKLTKPEGIYIEKPKFEKVDRFREMLSNHE